MRIFGFCLRQKSADFVRPHTAHLRLARRKEKAPVVLRRCCEDNHARRLQLCRELRGALDTFSRVNVDSLHAQMHPAREIWLRLLLLCDFTWRQLPAGNSKQPRVQRMACVLPSIPSRYDSSCCHHGQFLVDNHEKSRETTRAGMLIRRGSHTTASNRWMETSCKTPEDAANSRATLLGTWQLRGSRTTLQHTSWTATHSLGKNVVQHRPSPTPQNTTPKVAPSSRHVHQIVLF